MDAVVDGDAVHDVDVVGAVDGDAARAVEGGVRARVAPLASRESARLAGGGGEGERVERGARGVEEEEVPRAGPRKDRVGVGTRGRERVEVGEGGDRVAVLEDEIGRGEQREVEVEEEDEDRDGVAGGHGGMPRWWRRAAERSGSGGSWGVEGKAARPPKEEGPESPRP